MSDDTFDEETYLAGLVWKLHAAGKTGTTLRWALLVAAYDLVPHRDYKTGENSHASAETVAAIIGSTAKTVRSARKTIIEVGGAVRTGTTGREKTPVHALLADGTVRGTLPTYRDLVTYEHTDADGRVTVRPKPELRPDVIREATDGPLTTVRTDGPLTTVRESTDGNSGVDGRSSDDCLPPTGGGGRDEGDEPPSSSCGQVLLRDIGQRVGADLNDRPTSRLVEAADRLAESGWDVDSLDECGWFDDPDPEIKTPRAFWATRLQQVPRTPGRENPKTRPTTPTTTSKKSSARRSTTKSSTKPTVPSRREFLADVLAAHVNTDTVDRIIYPFIGSVSDDDQTRRTLLRSPKKGLAELCQRSDDPVRALEAAIEEVTGQRPPRTPQI